MNRYPCELIEDLLPLYVENDLKDKTRSIVEKHLRECKKCRKLLKDYSTPTLELAEFKETLPEASTFKAWMKKLKTYAAVLAVAAVLLVLSVGGLSYYIGAKQSSENQPHVFYAKSMDDVMQYYYDKTPGFKRAWKEGNTKLIGKSIKIPGDKGTLTIDRIWYSTDDIHVFYHIQGDIPSRVSAYLEWADNEKVGDHKQNMNLGEGIVYKDKFYSRLTFGNIKHRGKPLDYNTELRLEINPTLTYGKDEEFPLAEIEFSMNFDPAKEKVYTMELNGEVSLDKYGKIVFKKMVLKPQESYLYFDYLSDAQDKIQILAGTIHTDKGVERRLWIPVSPTNKTSPFYSLKFDALDTIPSQLTIKIQGIKLVTDEHMEFQIPVKRFHGELKDPGKESTPNTLIGSVKDAQIYLNRLFWDDRGLYFSMLTKYDSKPESNPLDRVSSTSIYDQWLVRHFKEKEVYKNWRFPNVVSIINEKGIKAKQNDYGSRGGGPGERVSMFIEKQYIESSKTLHITVSNLTYKAYGDWSGKIRAIKTND